MKISPRFLFATTLAGCSLSFLPLAVGQSMAPSRPSSSRGNSAGAVTEPSGVLVSTPPPTPKSESTPAGTDAPSAKHVWVPGYYQPVQDQWRWVAGSWQMPPLPESVWIEATYNERTRRWNQGHWQPDAPSHASPAP